jgi:hypothetical protein
VLLSLAFGVLAGLLGLIAAYGEGTPRDFGQAWYAARVLLDGGNPYDAIGPGRVFEWPWPFYYPLPAAIVALPFAPFSQAAGAALFMAIGGTTFTWALTEHGYWPLVGWTSGCMIFAVHVAQWSPLLASAMVVTPMSVVFAAKPNIGLAIFAARPSWWAVLGGLALCACAFAIQPHWVSDWLGALARPIDPKLFAAKKAPVVLPGGVFLLVGLLRWRRPEARLLVALACVPQTMTLYEGVPLLLVPRGRRECVVLTVLSSLLFLYFESHQWPDKASTYDAKGRWMLWCLYLPALIMVLRRPNTGELPTWLERVARRWPGWIRGVPV